MEDSESKIKTREEKLALAKELAAPIISSSNRRFRENSLDGQGRIDECEHEKWLNYWKDVYDDWLNVNFWEINEATCLLCGLNPDGLHNSNYPSGSYFSACWHDKQRQAGDSDFKKRFKKMNRLIVDGIEARELIRDATTYKLHKLTILKWAIIDKNLKIPLPLLEWFERQELPQKNDTNLKSEIERLTTENESLKKQLGEITQNKDTPEDKQLQTRSRNTLLKIIAVLIKHSYNDNLNEPYGSIAEEINNDTELAGIPVGKETIGDILKDVKSFLPDSN